MAEAAAEVRHAGAGAQELGERGQQGAFEGEGPEDVAEQVRVAVGDGVVRGPGGAAEAKAAVLLASTTAALPAGALHARRGRWPARQAGR